MLICDSVGLAVWFKLSVLNVQGPVYDDKLKEKVGAINASCYVAHLNNESTALKSRKIGKRFVIQ